jgi:hypothetical protein
VSLFARHRYSDGMTEGVNNKIKLIQRMAYGLRNEHNRRQRFSRQQSKAACFRGEPASAGSPPIREQEQEDDA